MTTATIIIRIHESPAVMWIPLAILAVLSLGGGFINIPKYLEPMFQLPAEGGDEWLMYVSVAFGLGGIALAYLFYRGRALAFPTRSRTRSAGSTR